MDHHRNLKTLIPHQIKIETFKLIIMIMSIIQFHQVNLSEIMWRVMELDSSYKLNQCLLIQLNSFKIRQRGMEVESLLNHVFYWLFQVNLIKIKRIQEQVFELLICKILMVMRSVQSRLLIIYNKVPIGLKVISLR